MNYFILIFIIALIIVYVIFRKNPIIEKYQKYILILIPFMVILVLKLLRKENKDNKKEDIKKYIEQIKEDMTDIKLESAAKIIVEKTKNEEKIKELEEIKKIDDKKERRKRLAQFIG